MQVLFDSMIITVVVTGICWAAAVLERRAITRIAPLASPGRNDHYPDYRVKAIFQGGV